MIKLIDDWRKAHKLLSFWVFVIVGTLPEFYHAVIALGWSDELPDAIKWILRGLGVLGISVRLVRQNLGRKSDG